MYLSLNVFTHFARTQHSAQIESLLTGNDKIKRGRNKGGEDDRRGRNNI